MIEIEPVSEAHAINMVHEVQGDLTSVTHKTVYLPLLTKVGTKKVSVGAAPQKNKTAYYKSQGDYYYVKFPEFGTIKQSPKPALQPALESNQEYINKCVEESLEKEIKKLGF